MRLLAFDTSTEWCTVALWLDGEVQHAGEPSGQAHSRRLLPMVTDLLAQAGLGLAHLDGIAFGRGPGSFTGLRIACGVAQGLAMGVDLPVLGVSTLEALAEDVAGEGVLPDAAPPGVITCLDARMGEIYAAAWHRVDAGWLAETGQVVCPPALAPLPAGPGYLGCGSGFVAHERVLAERYGDRLAGCRPEAIPHARAIARLAAPRFQAGQGVAPEQAEPYYVRDKVALKISER